MFITKDYCKSDPWVAIIDMINNAYDTQLQYTTTELVSLESLGGTSTRIKIAWTLSEDEANSMQVPPTDTFTYNRLDLGTFFKSSVYIIPGMAMPTTSLAVMDAMDQANAIVFADNDVVSASYTAYNTSYQLVAGADSLRFTGSMAIQFSNTTKVDLGTFTKLEYPQANVAPDGNTGTKQVGMYSSSSYDFTEYRSYLVDLKTTDVYPDNRKMASILKMVTGRPWDTSESAIPWNICFDVQNGAQRFKLIYNGKVLPRYSPRTDIDNVCVLQISSSLSTAVDGLLLLHYN